MPNAERGSEATLDGLKARRLALLAEFKTMWEVSDDRVINGLVALPQNELSERMNAMKKAVIKAVPVTALTRGYAAPHEIEAGARHKHDANPVLRSFFLGLASRLSTKFKGGEITLDQAQGLRRDIDRESFHGPAKITPEILHSIRIDENDPAVVQYRNLLKKTANAISVIGPLDSALAQVTIEEVASTLERKDDLRYRDGDIEIAVIRDLFIELLNLYRESLGDELPEVISEEDLSKIIGRSLARERDINQELVGITESARKIHEPWSSFP